jgi:hypothetical protein
MKKHRGLHLLIVVSKHEAHNVILDLAFLNQDIITTINHLNVTTLTTLSLVEKYC